jgi:hypothetical protein
MIVNDQNKFYTPYECATIVNVWFEEKDVDRTVPPQMMYNYVKNGRIATTELDGKKFVSETDLSEWFVKFYVKNVLGQKGKKDLQIPSNPIV